MQLNSKLARVAAGAAIVGAAGLTTAVAVADGSGPETGRYADYGYGYGSGYETQAGRAAGHRLHCPSYNGMYHSQGHAQCHYAPRGNAYGVEGAEDDNTNATQSQTSVQSNTASRSDDEKATTESTETDGRDDTGEQKAAKPTSSDQTQATSTDDAGEHETDQPKADDGSRHEGGHSHRGSDSDPYETNH